MIFDMETLPDYLREGLAIVSIGINPSLPSVASGFYFANPRNRFWKALNRSALVPEELTPGLAAQERLFHYYAIGFTDLVKRPSAGIATLRGTDYRQGASLLEEKLMMSRPSISWFHGKEAYRHYRKYTDGTNEPFEWGKQPRRIGNSVVFVTPNPSSANAAYSLEVLTAWYVRLGDLHGKLTAV